MVLAHTPEHKEAVSTQGTTKLSQEVREWETIYHLTFHIDKKEIAKSAFVIDTGKKTIEMGVYQPTVVDKDYRKKGIGTYMFLKRILIAREIISRSENDSISLITRNKESISDIEFELFLEKLGISQYKSIPYIQDHTIPSNEQTMVYQATLTNIFFNKAEQYCSYFEQNYGVRAKPDKSITSLEN